MTLTFAQDTFAGRTVASGLGAASDGINTWQSPNLNSHAVVSVGSNEGNIYYDNAGSGTGTYAANCGLGAVRDVNLSMRFSFLSSFTGSTEIELVARYLDVNNWYRVAFVGSHLFFIKKVAGSTTTTQVAAFTITASTYYNLRFQLNGSNLSATIWQDGTSEPAPQWSGTDTDISKPGAYGFVTVATGTSAGTGISFDSFLAQSSASQLTAIYVNGATGNDSNPGTQGSPLATLQAGLNLAVPGSIVHVAPIVSTTAVTMYASGTGTNPQILSFPQSSAPSTRIVIQSDTQASPVVSGTALRATAAQYPFQVLGSYVDILGFEVGGDSTANVGIHLTGPGCSVQHCYVHDVQSPNAIYTQGGGGIVGQGQPTSYTLVNANLVTNTGTSADLPQTLVQPIYVQSDHCTVTNNIVCGSYASGISAYHYANVITITNNVIANTYLGVQIGGSDGGTVCDNSVVANNIMDWYGSLYSGGGASPFGTYIVVREQTNTGLNNQYINNLVWGPSTGTAVGSGGHGPGWEYILQNNVVAVGTINVDPQFVNFQGDGSGDYHIQPTSPCVDAGVATGAPVVDFDGNPRPRGARYDIGAYESAPIVLTIAKDTALRPNQSGWGTASDGETWTFPSGTGTLAVAGNELTCTNASATGSNIMILGGGKIVTNGDLTTRFSMSGASSDIAGMMLRYIDNNNFIRIQVTNGHITLRRVVAGVQQTDTIGTSPALSNNTFYRVHTNINNNIYSTNVWLDGTSEPVGFQATQTDSGNNFVQPTQYGLYAFVGTIGDTISFDNFLVTSTPLNVYVSPTGNDSTGDGSLGNPYATITKADANIGAGSTVSVLPGTITYTASASTLANGTPLARIVWQASGGYGLAKLGGTMNNTDLWDAKGNYTDIVGFDISGVLVHIGVSVWGHHCRIFHCSAHDCGTALASGTAGAGFFDYIGQTTVGTNEWAYNTALRCGPIPASSALYHGFYLSASNDLLHDNISSNCSGYGFVLSGVNNATIAHNLAFFNSYAGFALSGSAGTSDFNTFENNISYNNNVPASGVLGNGFIILNTPGGTHNVWTNNCSFAHGFQDYASVSSGSATITPINSVFADPQFVNYRTDGLGNYHLFITSPCIDAGIINTVSTIDFDGNSRPQGAGYDIGPYEGGVYPPLKTYTYGATTLHDSATVYLQEKPFSTAPIVETHQKVARRDGMAFLGRATNARTIQTKIQIVGASRADLESKLSALHAGLALRQQPLTIYAQDNRQYIADATISEETLVAGKPNTVVATVTFTCQQPYAYTPTSLMYDTGRVVLTGSGTTWTFPIQTITGNGNTFSRPTIRIYQRDTSLTWTGVQIAQQLDNQAISIGSGGPTAANDYVDFFGDPVHSANGYTVQKNSSGTPITYTGQFPIMEPGDTPWLITINTSAAPHAQAIWTWMPRWLP